MKSNLFKALVLLMTLSPWDALAQCTSLRQQRNITFNTSGDCAPVDITDYTITYFFNSAQDPDDIIIHFEWNDPANSFDEYSNGDPEFIVDGTNRAFTATGTFTYPEDENCLFEPVAYVIVEGIDCETSEQTQLVSSWARDNNFGGNLEIDPGNFNVCFGNPVTGAVFEDNSTFNCNIIDEPDNPNRQDRYTQFVYGTNHDPGNSIKNLTLVDENGAVQDLTDNAGNLAMSSTLGGITAAYFGEIMHIPFPADEPDMLSLDIDAPADAANLIGDQFEITLYNWNVCNPYNGDPTNPNYDDAVEVQAYINIVQQPEPDFQTRLGTATGNIQSTFCLGENIYFENLTPGGFNYLWEFFDDELGVVTAGSSNNVNPIFSYNTSGDKLVRLTATDGNVQGDCNVIIESLIAFSPAAIAGISVMDTTFSNVIETVFCQDENNTLSFEIGFRDATTNVESVTEWRWEFYDADGILELSLPDGTDTFSSTSISDFTRHYSLPGIYTARLIARNQVTGCTTQDDTLIEIYPAPASVFSANQVCAGQRTEFNQISGAISSIQPRLNNDQVVYYDWDFSYDGITFRQELRQINNNPFEWYLDGNDVEAETEPSTSLAGSYRVALRLTTLNAACISMFTSDVVVNPLPVSNIDSDYQDPICPMDQITFINSSPNDSNSFELLIERNSDNDTETITFTGTSLNYEFINDLDIIETFHARILATNEYGCTALSEAVIIEVQPSSSSGFTDINYDPLGNNCSQWESTFIVNQQTQDLDADVYTWTIENSEGILEGYPVTVSNSSTGFNQLDYVVTNAGLSNEVYLATLEVFKTGVCVDDAQYNFQISPQPSSAFTIEPMDSCEYKLFKLEAVQKGLVLYNWQFEPAPDEIVQQNDVQLIRYERPQPEENQMSVVLNLQTTNLANCTSELTQQSATIDPSPEPIFIDFTISEDTIQLPQQTITISNLSTDVSTWHYQWNFGDGTNFTGYEPGEHAYSTFGTYNISLTVSNEFCERRLTKSLVVLPTVPIIDFEADVFEGCQPLTINFTNLSEFAVPGTYVWDFGDGTQSNQDNPSYTYFRSGVYTVQLRGKNELGTEGQRTKQFYIEVFEVPTANFAVNPEVVFIPNQQVFISNLSTDASSFTWDFGDGFISQEINPVHSYMEEGSFDIKLIAGNDNNCFDTLLIESVVNAIKGGQVSTPNAFTPNKSGPSNGQSSSAGSFNDVFIPSAEGITDFHMLIFNRWGQLLFESFQQSHGWDGYYQGKLMPMDVYVYKLELKFSDGREELKIGDVTLVR